MLFSSPGANDDGDIFNEDNLVEFRRFVMESTDNKGVHFVMADGVSKIWQYPTELMMTTKLAGRFQNTIRNRNIRTLLDDGCRGCVLCNK